MNMNIFRLERSHWSNAKRNSIDDCKKLMYTHMMEYNKILVKNPSLKLDSCRERFMKTNRLTKQHTMMDWWGTTTRLREPCYCQSGAPHHHCPLSLLQSLLYFSDIGVGVKMFLLRDGWERNKLLRPTTARAGYTRGRAECWHCHQPPRGVAPAAVRENDNHSPASREDGNLCDCVSLRGGTKQC